MWLGLDIQFLAKGYPLSIDTRGLRFSSQPIVRLRVLKDSTSFCTEAKSAPDVIGTKELSSAPQDLTPMCVPRLFFLFFRFFQWMSRLSHPSSLLE